MPEQVIALGTSLVAAAAHPEITPPVDGLGGALGRHVGADGGISAMSGGLDVALVIVLALLALAVGVAAARAASLT